MRKWNDEGKCDNVSYHSPPSEDREELSGRLFEPQTCHLPGYSTLTHGTDDARLPQHYRITHVIFQGSMKGVGQVDLAADHI
jgi:hypothetical protein